MEEKEKQFGEITRRDFLKDASLVVGGAAIGSTALLAACGGGEETTTVTTTVTSGGGMQAELMLLEPTGASASQITHLHAERLDTLDGKTIALMD